MNPSAVVGTHPRTVDQHVCDHWSHCDAGIRRKRRWNDLKMKWFSSWNETVRSKKIVQY